MAAPAAKGAKAPAKKSTKPKTAAAKKKQAWTGTAPGKSKINPAMIEKICGLIRDGNYPSIACKASGLSKEAYHEQFRTVKKLEKAMMAGELLPVQLTNSQKIAFAFVEKVEEALAVSETVDLQKIHKGENNWQAAAWKLERRFRSRWGRSLAGQGTPDADDDMVLPEDRSEDAGPAFGFMVPVALPEDVFAQVTEELRKRGKLPGQQST